MAGGVIVVTGAIATHTKIKATEPISEHSIISETINYLLANGDSIFLAIASFENCSSPLIHCYCLPSFDSELPLNALGEKRFISRIKIAIPSTTFPKAKQRVTIHFR